MSVGSGADVLLDLLVDAGVELVFGLPGGPILPLLDAIEARDDIRFVLSKHEEGAVYMAEGYAQAGGRLGVALVTTGPGATHALTATVSANSDRVPLLVVTGQVPTGSFGRGALQDSSGGNWSLDTVHMFRSATKLSAMITSGDQLPHLMRHAIHTATAPLPGAVHLSVPTDVLTGAASRCTRSRLPHVPPTHMPLTTAKQLAETLLQAERPVILAGQGAKLSGAEEALRAVAELGAIPVATTLKGKGVFPEDHDLALGVFGSYGGTARAHSALLSDQVDVLLVLGSSMGELSTFGWDPRLAAGRTVCQIDADPLQIGRTFPVDLAAVADAQAALDDLLAAIPRHRQPIRPSSSQPMPRSTDLQDDAPVLRASAVVARISETRPKDTLLFVDNGNCLGWVGEDYVAKPPGKIFFSLNVASMGYAIPATIGASFAMPDHPILAILGDGAFTMSGMDIHTAVEQQLSIIWVVLNNGGNAMVANIQQLLYGRTPGSLYDTNVDIAAVARGLGAQANVAANLDELDHALKIALDAGGPYLIDTRVDPNEIPWALSGRAATLARATPTGAGEQ